MTKTLGMAACLLAGSMSAAHAQTVAPRLIPGLHSGQRVFVTTTDGHEASGTIVSIAPMALELRTGDVVATVPVASVRRVETTDSVANGVRKGALGHEGRRVLFDSSARPRTVAIAPLVSGGTVGLGGVIRW